MSRLKLRSTNPKEGKRAPRAGVLHWESRDRLPVTHIPWTRLSQREDVRWEVTTEGNIVIVCISSHGIAEGLHGHVAEKLVLSFDAQSESAVPCQRVFPWETRLSHRQEIVYINACRAPGSENEPGGPFLADVDSIRKRLLSWYEGAFHISPRLALAYEMPSPPSARFSTVTVPAESAEPEDADPELRCRAIVESLQRPDLGQEERRKLILEAEVLPFRGQQAAALTPLLKRFIEEHCKSDVPADRVAVGSAIRKYVAKAPLSRPARLPLAFSMRR